MVFSVDDKVLIKSLFTVGTAGLRNFFNNIDFRTRD